MKKIFIADFLPLANKGEEEIIRGIETLYKCKIKDDVEFRVFGDVEKTVQVDNVVVYPRSICYPLEQNYSGKKRIIRDTWMAIKGFWGVYPYKSNMEKNPNMMRDLCDCDKVLIGHDGFFNIRCSLLGLFLAKNGIKYSILGAGFNRPNKKIAWIYDKVYKKCFDKADYIVLREQTAYKYVKEISSNGNVSLLPDPAFFCPSDKYRKEWISHMVSKYRLNEDGLKIGITICENSISFSTAFKNSIQKKKSHRDFIANILRYVYDKTKCKFYFLPHCIEEGAGNDLVIARDIVSRLGNDVSCEIIEEDMPVLDIKHIISKMDMMIGERTHSIINSISTATPFLSLTCSADFRTHDIVGKGCGLEDNVYDMDYPDVTFVENKVMCIIGNLAKERERLDSVCKKNESYKEKFIQII